MNTIWKHMRCWEGKALATSATSSTGTSPSLPRLACNALHIFQGRRPDSLSRATRVAFGKGQPGQPPTTIQSLWSFGHGSGSFSLQLGIQFGKSFRRCYLSKKHQKAKCHSKQEQKLPLLHAMPPCHAMPVHLLNAQASASSTSFQCVVASFFPVHRCLLLHQTALAKLKSGINFGACQVVINWEASESAAKLFDSAFSLPD